MGFGFHEEFMVVCIEYPADLEQVVVAKNEAHFLVRPIRWALGARAIETGKMAPQVLKLRESA